jgi:hypothetical protein
MFINHEEDQYEVHKERHNSLESHDIFGTHRDHIAICLVFLWSNKRFMLVIHLSEFIVSEYCINIFYLLLSESKLSLLIHVNMSIQHF